MTLGNSEVRPLGAGRSAKRTDFMCFTWHPRCRRDEGGGGRLSGCVQFEYTKKKDAQGPITKGDGDLTSYLKELGQLEKSSKK